MDYNMSINDNNKRIDFNENVKTTVKKNIKRLRDTYHLSKRDVARALGMNENTYRVWEDPKKTCPKLYDILRIAKMYGVTTDFIITNKYDGESISKIASISSSNLYNNGAGKQLPMSSLSKEETILIMSFRQLNAEKKEEYLNNIAIDVNKMKELYE